MSDNEIAQNFALTEFSGELRRLADALESGAPFSIELDGETVIVPAEAVVSVEYEEEEGEAELEFQLTWAVEDEDEEDEEETSENDEEDEHEAA